MNGWAGFWIGCGLVVMGVGLGHIGDSIRYAARKLGKAYKSTFHLEESENEEHV